MDDAARTEALAARPERGFDIEAHRRALMLDRRCPHCAERIDAAVLLRGRPCPSCRVSPKWPALEDVASVVDGVQARWGHRRFWAYGILALATAAAGLLPLLSTLVTIVFMTYLRYAVLYKPLKWFAPARRFTTSFALQLWLVTTGLLTLALDAALGLVPVAGFALKAVACVGSAALFVELALLFLRGRLRREASEGPELEWWEWALPSTLIGGTFVASAVAIAMVVLLSRMIAGLFD